jgi:hypothetical protein
MSRTVKFPVIERASRNKKIFEISVGESSEEIQFMEDGRLMSGDK